MRNQEWDSPLAQLYPLDLCQLVFCFFRGNAVDCEASFGVIDEAEVLACLLDRDNIHETGRICGVGADLTIYFDKALHDDSFGFAGVESVLQTGTSRRKLPYLDMGYSDSPVTDEDNKWHAISELVRTWGWARRIGTGQFVQKPMRGRAETLLMLFPTVISATVFEVTNKDDENAIRTVRDP